MKLLKQSQDCDNSHIGINQNIVSTFSLCIYYLILGGVSQSMTFTYKYKYAHSSLLWLLGVSLWILVR